MMLEVNGKRKRRWPKTWRKQVEEGVKKVGCEDRRSCRSNEMEGRCEGNRRGNEMYLGHL